MSGSPILVEKSRIGNGMPAGANASLFVEDDSLHFDYGHCLPESETCSVVHGHSSRLSVELFGNPQKNGMIVDFGVAKDRIRRVMKDFDHKFIVGKKYTEVNGTRVRISFTGPNGHIEMDLPREHVILMHGEATSENISEEIANRLMKTLPADVVAVKAFFFEGASKGAATFRVRGR